MNWECQLTFLLATSLDDMGRKNLAHKHPHTHTHIRTYIHASSHTSRQQDGSWTKSTEGGRSGTDDERSVLTASYNKTGYLTQLTRGGEMEEARCSGLA